ncbi:SMI1/KNR4 family protein [Streptomyces sp. Da 82-17]|uniref:SMI1/KNR4 family protein n=1 Tax=Streptomyces sp. Da 82-17 TaxID=3377116 RepID=UPI0038D400A0
MTEELISTQAPQRRLTDASEALTVLERALTGLAGLRRPRPAAIDWAALEEGLGTALPSDYKLLAEWQPPFVIGEFLLVDLPEPGREQQWLTNMRGALDVLADTWADPALGLAAHPEPGGLLPWGSSCDGDRFLWRTHGRSGEAAHEAPQEWNVTVGSRGGAWWQYGGGMAQFLAEYGTGAVEPWELPPIDPEVTPC